MKILKKVETFRAESEMEAENFIKTEKEEGNKEGFEVVKNSCEHKITTKKGEIEDEYYIVTLTKKYD